MRRFCHILEAIAIGRRRPLYLTETENKGYPHKIKHDTRSLVVIFSVGLLTGLWGIRWGLPGPARLRAFPERLRPTPEVAQKFADAWARLYEDIKLSHEEVRLEEPVTYAQGLEEVPAGWDFPPPKLLNSYRSFLLQSENPDEKKSFIILSQMRPWKLDFKPLYSFYGGSFIYPLGAFLKLSSMTGAFKLVADMRHYLMHPEDMGMIYLAGRVFILLFHLGSLWIIYDVGTRLSGRRAGLCAALLFALCPAVISNSHLIKPHPYAAFWALAAARSLLLAASGGAKRDYVLCGLFAGMATGANFSLAPLIGLPALAWLKRRLEKTSSPDERGRALLGLLCAALACLAANPYLVFCYKDFAWDRQYVSGRGGFNIGALGAMLLTTVKGMGLVLGPLSALGSMAALGAGGQRRLLAAVFWMTFFPLWFLFWSFSEDIGSLRLYYPLLGLGAIFAADLLLSRPWPKALKALALAALLADNGLRSFVCLENMRLDAGPLSTRTRAADWIEKNIPAGATVGLVRYPEPAHTPPFLFDSRHLVISSDPQALPTAKLPRYFIVDEPGRRSVDEWIGNQYEMRASFLPKRLGWVPMEDDSSFINEAMFIYELKAGSARVKPA